MLSTDITLLKQHFEDNWEGPTAFLDNQPSADIPDGEPWVRFSVRPSDSKHGGGSSDSGYLHQIGRVWLQVFVPEQTGDGLAISLAESFGNMFRHKRLDYALYCGTPDYNIDPTLDNGFYMISVSVPWDSRRQYS